MGCGTSKSIPSNAVAAEPQPREPTTPTSLKPAHANGHASAKPAAAWPATNGAADTTGGGDAAPAAAAPAAAAAAPGKPPSRKESGAGAAEGGGAAAAAGGPPSKAGSNASAAAGSAGTGGAGVCAGAARDSPLVDVIRGEAFAIRDAVKEALPSMVFPVSAAAKEVVTLATQAAGCLANADNLASLRQRAAAGLSLLHMFGGMLADTAVAPAAAAAAAAATGGDAASAAAGTGLHAVVSSFRTIVAGMTALARPYCGRSVVVHMLAADAAAERAAFEKLVLELTALADAVVAATRAHPDWGQVEGGQLQARADEALLVLRLGPNYTDHLFKLQGAVKEAGGLEAVCNAPGAFLESALVIQELSVGSRISKDLAIDLLTTHADKGPARLIPQPELRLLWHHAFGPEPEVAWEEWWEAFPSGIADLPGLGNGPLAEKLGAMLASDSSKSAFQRHVQAANNVVPVAGAGVSEAGAGLSAYALAAAFAAPLTDASAAGLDDLAGDVAVALAAADAAVHGPCQLPPLPALHVPRGEAADVVVAALSAGAPDKCKAVCLTGPSGVGKTTLALELAALLVAGGGAAGGCVWVDLAGARTWHDVEARLMIALGLIKDNTDGRPRIASTLRACCSGSRPLLLVVDSVDDPLRQPGAADGLWGLLGQVVGECGGVRLLMASSAPVTLADGAEIVNVEVPPLPAASAAALVSRICPDLSAGQAAKLGAALHGLPLALRLACGALVEGRLSVQDVEAIGANAFRPRPGSEAGPEASPAEATAAVIAAVLTALPTQHQVALLQLSALPPAGAGPDATFAVLAGSPGGGAAIPTMSRAVLAALQRQGLAAQSTMPGRTTQTVMHSLVRQVVVSALAPALDLAVRPAAEDRMAGVVLGALVSYGRLYGSREGGSSVLAAARAAQPEFAELLALLSRTTPRSAASSDPPPILSGQAATAEEAAAAASARLPLDSVVGVAKAFTGDLAELLHGLGALPAMEAVCEALSAPAVGLNGNRAYKVEMANVYRVHALALIAQGKFEEAQAHGNMCIQLRQEAAKKNPASPAIASANMCLAAAFAGLHYYSDAEELLREAVTLCVSGLGNASPHTAWAQGALAGVLEAQPAKAAEAEELYRRALTARQTAQGPHHPRTIEAALALAAYLSAAGRHADAQPLFADAAVAALRVFGEYHAATAAAIGGAAAAADELAAAEAEAAAGDDAAAAAAVAAAAAAQDAAHGRAAAIVAALRLEGREGAAVLLGRGRSLALQGRAKEAEAALRGAADIATRTLPRDDQNGGRLHPLAVRCLRAHGNALVAAGRAAEGQAQLDRALQGRIRLAGTQAHPEVAAIGAELAAAALASRRYAAAEPLCRQALAMAQHGVGMDSMEAALALSAYGRCVMLQGRAPTAEPLLRQALDVREKAEGADSLGAALARLELAACLAAQQDEGGAEQQYRAALDVLRALPAGEARGQAGCRAAREAAAAAAHGLGVALCALHRAAEAEALLKEALEARRGLLGQDHKDTGASLSALASCLGGQGRYAEAEELFRAELAAVQAKQGPTHPNTATAMSALAGCLQAQGKLSDAEPLLMSSRNICTSQLGPDHPNTLTVTANLAACLAAQGRHAEAHPLYEAELEATKRVQGEDHPDVATSLNHLATCLQALDRLEEAQRCGRQAVELFRLQLGDQHPSTALGLNTLALVLLARGQPGEARVLLEEAMTTCTSRLGPAHPWTVSTKKNLEAAQEACKAAGA